MIWVIGGVILLLAVGFLGFVFFSSATTPSPTPALNQPSVVGQPILETPLQKFGSALQEWWWLALILLFSLIAYAVMAWVSKQPILPPILEPPMSADESLLTLSYSPMEDQQTFYYALMAHYKKFYDIHSRALLKKVGGYLLVFEKRLDVHPVLLDSLGLKQVELVGLHAHKVNISKRGSALAGRAGFEDAQILNDAEKLGKILMEWFGYDEGQDLLKEYLFNNPEASVVVQQLPQSVQGVQQSVTPSLS